MKKVIVIFGLLALTTGFNTGYSQSHDNRVKKERKANLTPEDIARKKTDRMVKSLGLDKDQEKAMYEINLDHAEEQAKLKAERQALRQKYESEKENYQNNIDQVLTEEQKQKLEEMKVKKHEKHKHGNPPPPPPAPPAPER